MRTAMLLRCGAAALAILITAGCGGTGVAEPTPEVLSGPPPKPPTNDAMQPTAKSKRAAKNHIPRAIGGPPPIPRH